MSFNVTPEMLLQMEANGDTPHCDSLFSTMGALSVEIGIGKRNIYRATNINASGEWIIVVTPIDPSSPPPPPPIEIGLIEGIDVSSYQPRDLSGLIALSGARHVVVKLYQSFEIPPQEHSIDQIESARLEGATAGGYFWLYRVAPADARAQVRGALAVADEAGLALPVLWVDVEDYTDGTIPTARQVSDALDECAKHSVLGGVYWNEGIWRRLGSPDFGGVPLWAADWDEIPLLDTPAFGDMILVGKQYTSTAPDGSPLDRNVFLASFAGY